MEHFTNILTFKWLEKLQAPCERREVFNVGALGENADWEGASGVGIPTEVSCKDVCMPINILRALVTVLALGCTISAIAHASLALGVVAATIYTLNLTVTMFGASAQQVSAVPQEPEHQVSVVQDEVTAQEGLIAPVSTVQPLVLDEPALQFALPQYPEHQVPELHESELHESESLESKIQKYAEEWSRNPVKTWPSIEELDALLLFGLLDS